MAKRDLSASRCKLGLEEHCGSYINCQGCGWWPDEIERRKKLPLVPDKDGILRKVIRRGGSNGDESE